MLCLLSPPLLTCQVSLQSSLSSATTAVLKSPEHHSFCRASDSFCVLVPSLSHHIYTPFTLRSQLKCPFRQASLGNLIKIRILFPTECHCSQTQKAFFLQDAYVSFLVVLLRVHFGNQKPYHFVLKWRTGYIALIKMKKSIDRLKRQKEAIEVPERQ